MVVLSYRTIRDFSEMHPTFSDALNNWYRIIEKGDFTKLSELREVFNHVDYVGNDRYVFNIRGNNIRLIALIQFNIRTVYILFIGTHEHYNKINATTIQYKK